MSFRFSLTVISPEGNQDKEEAVIEDCSSAIPLYFELCFEGLGKKGKAANYWREYLKLDPAGEWADIARNYFKSNNT